MHDGACRGLLSADIISARAPVHKIIPVIFFVWAFFTASSLFTCPSPPIVAVPVDEARLDHSVATYGPRGTTLETKGKIQWKQAAWFPLCLAAGSQPRPAPSLLPFA